MASARSRVIAAALTAVAVGVYMFTAPGSDMDTTAEVWGAVIFCPIAFATMLFAGWIVDRESRRRLADRDR